MQFDGNLVIYKQGGGYSWASNTGGHPSAAYHLDDQNDGNVVIYPPSGPAPWSTETWNANNTEGADAGDCWKSDTPLMCRNTWSTTRPFVYFRAIDQFSGDEPGWTTSAQQAVSNWNSAPGPQYYSFTARANDTWVYLKTGHTGNPVELVPPVD